MKSPTLDLSSCRVDESILNEDQENLGIPTAASLFEDSNTPISSVETEACILIN